MLNTDELGALFKRFLAATEAFADFDEHVRRKGPDIPNRTDAIFDVLGKLANEPFDLGLPSREIRESLSIAGDNIDKLQTWFSDTFPVVINNRVRFTSLQHGTVRRFAVAIC